MTEGAGEHVGVRPELISLDAGARQRVLELIAVKGGHCEACGANDFAVGDAMIMGFLFLDEEPDAYMVALTCGNPECPKPRTAIRLCGKDFLSEEQRDRAVSLRSSIA
ncbi:hypothetical protein [Mycobacterium paraseoulense]|uniref:Uncharacterized protein n=1 Tax=Mycobacterium paraseoulense TaxID=590652 RepID=A0A1X0IDZ2_9MYCO|nr:hypothetical protein [Mycobacterium paraseoulense]MCV7393613.1 hypothetical protein [Mycobacterium paraseoulense]ORB44239.1 hypothetical protein BST39_06945 [Mycobacterium paraseoulense]BBZ71165.1 hypothetical protein MPRS_22580 [Mycobacterium paraseoulense]